MRIISLLSLFLFLNSLYAQNKTSKKEWEVVMFLDGFKAKGILESVTDSSAIIIVRKNYTDEILFGDIHKIKIRAAGDKVLARLAGFFIGGTTGGIIVGTLLSQNRAGEPRALAGVLGGIGGGLIIGVASAIIAPGIVKLFPQKIIIVKQDSSSLASLKQQLIPYSKNK